jgi:hypothetical protein
VLNPHEWAADTPVVRAVSDAVAAQLNRRHHHQVQ